MVSKLGYRVAASTDCVAALEAFRKNPNRYDLVITDMTMPNLTGKQLAEEMRRIRSDIPIILCSGIREDFDNTCAGGNGMTEFAMKPLGMQELAQTIRRVLDEGKVERRRFPRFLANTGAFVISCAEPSHRGELVDISLSGLSFRYLDAAQEFGRVDEVSVYSADRTFSVDNLKCRTVSDLVANSDTDSLSTGLHRRGVQFEDLTPAQMEQLRYFIQENVKEISN
jgi:DNA-binding response OmpR family regulator